MTQFYTPKLFKTCIIAVMYSLFFNNCDLKAQSSFSITKPFIGTSQVCVNSANANYTYLGYAFSSNVINTAGNIPSHSIEISNDLGLITPRIISSVSPNLNVIYVGNLLMSGQNLPIGSGYKIRITTSNPTVYSAFSDPFTILESPNTPILNQTGTVIICSGTSQTFTITNPNNAYSYQWQNNAANILNETTINYSTNVGGNYSVKVMHPNGCSVSSNTAYTYQNGSMNPSMNAQGSNYESGNPLFLTSNQGFNLSVSINGGKSPYSFTLTDGITNTTETNINSTRQYSFVAPVSGSKTYTLSTLTDACGTQLNNSANVKIRINNSKYCPTSRNGSLGIKNFSVQGTSVNNLNSGRAADGWGEYLNPANINANVNYNFSITPITTTTQQYFSIWTDLNQNGIFETNEKVFPLGNSTPQSITNTFAGVLKLPSTSFNGQTRMRVLLSSNYPSPCDLNGNGETEDYVLNVFNGVLPIVITTDSLPKNGVCFGQILPVNFTISGALPPNNTSYKVEVSTNSDFSNPTIIGTGQSSPINCNINTLNFYNSQGFYLRVLPVTTISNKVINPSPNRLRLKTVPTVNFGSLIGNRSDQATSFINTKSLSIEPPILISILAKISGTPPFSVELSDGRVFTTNSQTENIVIEANKLLTNDTKFKLVRISDNLCSASKSDSVNIYVGSPSITINKVHRSYNDTTSITKLCGQFVVAYSATHLDSVYCRTFAVQLSDQNGSFANPTNIGYDCVNYFSSESGTSRFLSCSIPTNLLNSTGYKLRMVKLSTNLLSPVYATNFELINSTSSFGFNINKTEMNEGESATLNVNFSGGTSPYTINLNSYNRGTQSFSTALNSSSLTANLSPLYSEKYSLGFSSACYSGNTNQNIYLSVRTLDQNNAQWYVKPYQSNLYYELLRGLYLISGSDTLFKRPYNSSVPNGIINQYYDYNSPLLLKPTSVLRTGENYSLSQIYSSSYGSNNLMTGIWIDSNQDGDFDDVGEELAKNTISQFWTVSQIQNISIPTNSNVGFSRMRVRVAIRNDAQFFSFLASNPLDKYADTYDIPIVVLSNTVTGLISTPKIAGNALCNGNTFSVDFTQYGIPAGTTASVELSDASGNFGNSPNVIGQGISSTINVTLPMNMTAGNYKIRVVSNGITSPVSPSFNVIINQLTSMVDGDWHAGSTWSCGRVPTYVDATTVAGGTTVTVFSGDARVGSIFTNGNLSFLNGTTLRFRQP